MYLYGKHGEEYEFIGDEVEECRKEQDFTPEQYDTIRRYYRGFVASPAYANKYGMPASAQMIEVLLIKRLRVMPNLHHVRIVRFLNNEHPFRMELYGSWADNGIEEWDTILQNPTVVMYHHRDVSPGTRSSSSKG